MIYWQYVLNIDNTFLLIVSMKQYVNIKYNIGRKSLRNFWTAFFVFLTLLWCGDRSEDPDGSLRLSEVNKWYRDALCELLSHRDYQWIRAVIYKMPDKENAQEYWEWIIWLDSIRKSVWKKVSYFNRQRSACVAPYYANKINSIFTWHDRFIHKLEWFADMPLEKTKLIEEFERFKKSKYATQMISTNPKDFHEFLDHYSYWVDVIIDHLRMKDMDSNEQMTCLLTLLKYIEYKHDEIWWAYTDSINVLMKWYYDIRWTEEWDEWINQYMLPPWIVLMDMFWDCDKKSMLAYWVLRKLGRHVAMWFPKKHAMVFFSNKNYLPPEEHSGHRRKRSNSFNWNWKNYFAIESTNPWLQPGSDYIPVWELEGLFNSSWEVYYKPNTYFNNKKDSCTVCDGL